MPYGTIKLIHTECKPDQMRDDLVVDPLQSLSAAKPHLALRDLKRVRRNVDRVVTTAEEDGSKLGKAAGVKLRGSVVRYDNPTDPIAEDDWEAAR